MVSLRRWIDRVLLQRFSKGMDIRTQGVEVGLSAPNLSSGILMLLSSPKRSGMNSEAERSGPSGSQEPEKAFDSKTRSTEWTPSRFKPPLSSFFVASWPCDARYGGSRLERLSERARLQSFSTDPLKDVAVTKIRAMEKDLYVLEHEIAKSVRKQDLKRLKEKWGLKWGAQKRREESLRV